MALTTQYGTNGIGRFGYHGSKDALSAKQKQVLAGSKKKKKFKTKAKAAPKKDIAYAPGLTGEDFYQTREWLTVRYQALETYGATCQCCGATRKDGATLQVDHIHPRSIYPGLELAITNLQVLCRPCNLGKSNKSTKDWR